MQKIKIRIITIILVCLAVINAIFFTEWQKSFEVKAESIIYTNVLDDLKKDTSFKPENYPSKADDYSLQIIQLAESVNKELFVYVYQPSGKAKDFKASSINVSTTINDNISYLNYKLELLNSSGVFYKYKVVGLTVKDESVRYYAISSIYRPFDESIDKQASGGNTVTEVNYAVNKQYAFGSINGKPYVNCVDIETIVVTDKFVGFVRYKDGFKLYVGACDSHFVAFNTDKPIDKLLEADVYYTTQSYDWSSAPFVGVKETFGDKADKYAYLKYTDKVEHTGDGWFAGTYKWDRIQTIDDFIKGENRENIYHGAVLDVKTSSKLTDEALAELKGKKWVLRFAETSYSLSGYSTTGSTFESYTLVGDVTILRLKFETDGITYNLGVIDNKQTGGKEPSNETEIDVSLNDNGKTILYLLLLILLVVLCAPILPYVLQGVLWIITLPVKGVSALIKSIKRRRAEKRVRKEFADRWKDIEK
mgnify:CR=1 FL=1